MTLNQKAQESEYCYSKNKSKGDEYIATDGYKSKVVDIDYEPEYPEVLFCVFMQDFKPKSHLIKIGRLKEKSL